MERQRVTEGKSKLIAGIGYDKDTQTLEVEFLIGSVYQYRGVPESIYDEFCRADSLGQFMLQRIRGAYEYHRLHSDGRTRISKCEDAACWCAKLTASSREEEKPSEEKKASKKKTKKAR
jgi:hypothetical protein